MTSPTELRVQGQIQGWITPLFEDAALMPEAEARQAPRALALVAVVDMGSLAWFSAPLGWSDHQALSLGGLFPFAPLDVVSDRGWKAAGRISVHHLVLGPEAKVRWFGQRLDQGTALGGRTASGKTITAVVPRLGEGVILKHSRLVANLSREVAALKERPRDLLAPRHLGSAHPREGEMITAQSLLPGQPLQWVGPITEEQEGAVLESLQHLVQADQQTSVFEQARCLQAELAVAPLPGDQRMALERLLAGAEDRRPVPASRLHGDLRPLNLQVCPLEREGTQWRCGLGLLDWEFSRPCGLGVTDYLRLLLDSAYRESRSFAELLNPFRLNQLRAALARLELPGADWAASLCVV